MKRFQATVYFLLLSIILFCMSSACLADDTADKFEISTSTDKQVYNESDTISIVVKIQNISPDKRVLEHKFEKDDSLLGLGVYIKGTGKLHIFPDDLDLKSTITINSGETIDIKYELPAYRVVLYSDYAEEVEFDIQGPWLKDASIEKTDLVISTNYKEASPPVSGPKSINDLFLNNDIRIGNSLVKATDEHLLYLSNIPLAVEFAEKTKDFDGLIFNHVYITGGDYYSELFVILCSRTSDIEALVLRTWPDEGIKSSLPKVLESFRFKYQEGKAAKDAEDRFRIEYKAPSDFGYTRLYDNWANEMLFEASSVWMGRGTLVYPKTMLKRGIRELYSERMELNEEISRFIDVKSDLSLDEIEKLFSGLGLRISYIHQENCKVQIPPNTNRAKYVKLLKENSLLGGKDFKDNAETKKEFSKEKEEKVITLSDGSKYAGEWKDGKKHGYGTFTTPAGGTYVGEWKNDKMQGHGTLTTPEGSEYVGEFEDNKMHGQGIHTWPNGWKYVGAFKERKMHGQGTLTTSEGDKYVGEWKDGKIHGQGTKTWPDGSEYVGVWQGGMAHGRGEFTWPDGSKYVGEFIDDRMQGHGTKTWSDGWKYVGEFKDGMMHGQGTLTMPDGEKYMGEFKDNKKYGQRKKITSDGSKYAGEQKNGKQHDQERAGINYVNAMFSISVTSLPDWEMRLMPGLRVAELSVTSGPVAKRAFIDTEPRLGIQVLFYKEPSDGKKLPSNLKSMIYLAVRDITESAEDDSIEAWIQNEVAYTRKSFPTAEITVAPSPKVMNGKTWISYESMKEVTVDGKQEATKSLSYVYLKEADGRRYIYNFFATSLKSRFETDRQAIETIIHTVDLFE